MTLTLESKRYFAVGGRMQGKLGKERLGKGTHYKHLEHGRKMIGSHRPGDVQRKKP